MSIKIKPSKKGTLHDALGISRDKKIPSSRLKIHEGDSSSLKKKKQFAINAKKWKHEDGGIIALTPEEQFNGLNNSSKNSMVFPNQGNNIFRGLDNGQPVLLQDSTGKKKVLTGPQDTITMTGTVKEKKLKAQQGASLDWNSEWVKSPMAQKMNQGEEDFTPQRLQALDEVGNPIPVDPKELAKISGKKSGNLGVYNSDKHTVSINNKIKDPDLLDTVITHEKSHAADRGGKLMSQEDLKLTDSEGRALLNQARQEFQKDGTYDPFTQPFKLEYLKEKNNGIRNLKKKYSDVEITNLMNSVSLLNNTIPLVAKKGMSLKGKIKKAQQGAEFDWRKPKELTIPSQTSMSVVVPEQSNLPNNRQVNYSSYGDLKNNIGGDAPTMSNTPPSLSNITVPDSVRDYKTPEALQGAIKNPPQKKSPSFVTDKGKDHSLDMGAFVTGGIGLAQMFLGPEGPRRRIDNTLAYNPYPQGTGSMALAKKGKSISPSNQGSGLVTYEGGNAPKMSENMFDGGTHLFTGDSHIDGGITSSFNGTPFEAEGGEPFAKIEGKGVVFGDMENPLTGRTYKKDAKEIMKKEQKVQKYLDKGTELVNDSDPTDKFQLLAFNSGTAMMKGGAAKQKQLAESKKHLADLQEVHLEIVGEDGKTAQKGWSYQGTNTAGLDDKIKAFADLVKSKGYTGYSGAKSGVDSRMTKSGHPSRHIKGQALDMVLDTPDAYNTLLKDPDIAAFAIQNGLTLINEYDPKVASKTGATGGHIHVGYDRGTSTSDQFRKDALALYPNLKPGKGIAPSPLKGTTPLVAGDAYTETPQFKMPDYTVKDPSQPVAKGITPLESKPYEFTKVTPETITPTRDKLKLSQIMGEIPAIFDKPDFVEGGHYNPDLYTPYQVSFQDRINQNSKNFNALGPSLVNNPEAQSVLAGQLYSANNAVQADEFRTNQAISNDITNKNVSLLNDAKLKNISLVDQKYVRQSQAKSITKENRTNALNSISSKILQKEASNNMLNVYKNLYPHYDFDKNYQVQKQNAPGQEYINWNSVGDSPQTEGKTVTSYDANGVKKGSRVTTDSPYSQMKEDLQLELLRQQVKDSKLKPIKINANSVFPKNRRYGSNGLIVKKYNQSS